MLQSSLSAIFLNGTIKITGKGARQGVRNKQVKFKNATTSAK